jgi:hypothetical protein
MSPGDPNGFVPLYALRTHEQNRQGRQTFESTSDDVEHTAGLTVSHRYAYLTHYTYSTILSIRFTEVDFGSQALFDH